jgi:transcriptional regulator with PAS, ATPase and Fis domain
LTLAINKLIAQSEDLPCEELDSAILGQSPAMVKIKRDIVRLAKSDVTVLVTGETGTGKELVARAIHQLSPRANKPFVKVNSAALPSNLLESELFGFEKGAFTGAFHKKPGKFELAHLGTIFLDEIGDIPLAMQAKLLQVLQDCEFSPLGSVANTTTDVRALAATRANLADMVSQGLFRSDLYYRLNVVSIHIPPLRERKEDIDLLCTHFQTAYAARHGREYAPLNDRIRKRYYHYSWPGNVRELENLIQSITVLGSEGSFHKEVGNDHSAGAYSNLNDPLTEGDLVGTGTSGLGTTVSLKKACKEAAQEAETQAIMEVLSYTRWNRIQAAALLKTSYKNLLKKIKEYEIGLA